jgi:hypothetical protein
MVANAVFPDGRFDDSVEDVADLSRDIEEWAGGRFPYLGQVLTVDWLDDAVSNRTRVETFTLEEPDRGMTRPRRS